MPSARSKLNSAGANLRTFSFSQFRPGPKSDEIAFVVVSGAPVVQLAACLSLVRMANASSLAATGLLSFDDDDDDDDEHDGRDDDDNSVDWENK